MSGPRIGPGSPSAARAEEPDVLRVMSWNIKDLHGDPLAVHRVIRAAAADVVCLQEAPRLVLTRLQLRRLARAGGLIGGAGGRAGAGTAIITGSRARVHHVWAHRLPVAGRLTRPRGFARLLVALPGTGAVSVTSMHLGLDPQQRADHVDRLLRGLMDEVPVVLAGDLNERPDGASWHTLSNWAVDPGAVAGAPATFSARRPRLRIDAVLVDPRLAVLDYGDPPGLIEDDVRKASDHRPVFARIRLPAGTDRP